MDTILIPLPIEELVLPLEEAIEEQLLHDHEVVVYGPHVRVSPPPPVRA